VATVKVYGDVRPRRQEVDRVTKEAKADVLLARREADKPCQRVRL